jgi:hypothetical protein
MLRWSRKIPRGEFEDPQENNRPEQVVGIRNVHTFLDVLSFKQQVPLINLRNRVTYKIMDFNVSHPLVHLILYLTNFDPWIRDLG